ncbi:MAG TPA: hypothetical protein VF599_20340 [Pyrinomonadaceae bacterium]|jgi:hypothetical protein
MKAVILLFIILLASCSQKPELIIPDAGKDKIFTDAINPITDRYGLEKLRETSLAGDDLEVRVWIEAGAEGIDGFVLKRVDDNWSAAAVKQIDCRKLNYYPKDKTYELGKINLSAPKSGWENAWQKLVAARMLDLPYSDYILTIDESAYALETNINGIYKIRFYGAQEKSPEAVQMSIAGEIIADEFGLHNFKIGSLCLEK